MKESNYNIYAENGGYVVLFNALNCSFGLTTPKQLEFFLQSINDNNFSRLSPQFYQRLVDGGFLIEDDVDEQNILQNRILGNKYSTNTYSIIINTSLDCNLSCWYCYENHIKNSFLNSEIQDRIIKHLEYKHLSQPFKELSLSFFGGEPLLPFKKSVLPLITAIRKFVLEKKIELSIHFTTNGVALNNTILEVLKDIPSSFQITLDGCREQHNKIRFFKDTKIGTYDIIVKNIKRIAEVLPKANITVRINFTLETLRNITSVLNDFEGYNSRVSFSLHRVWQADDKTIDKMKIIEFIDDANKKGYRVEYGELDFSNPGCYADVYNEVVINYEGSVYKCTARNFTEENREGKLMPDGTIAWDVSKLQKRLNVPSVRVCDNCKLLPCCSGVCSQNKMEGNGGCFRSVFPSLEDYVVYNFNKLSKL